MFDKMKIRKLKWKSWTDNSQGLMGMVLFFIVTFIEGFKGNGLPFIILVVWAFFVNFTKQPYFKYYEVKK